MVTNAQEEEHQVAFQGEAVLLPRLSPHPECTHLYPDPGTHACE